MEKTKEAVRKWDRISAEELKDRVQIVLSNAEYDPNYDSVRACLENMADDGTSPELFEKLRWPMELLSQYASLLYRIERHLASLQEQDEEGPS